MGTLGRIAPKKLAITEVVLRPRIDFAPAHAADDEQIDAMHEAAHEACFIANSVKTTIRVESRR